ncbi:hypothetical protein [Nonomuraea angiospora]|uniref:hypothetical protein n=1 Tax=Nonomuraea angiospora TaxID=46172 RepID=UPI0029BDDC95|nr:hypothetical protein [Nonomuraea angiospora]MDX3108881.1 hypothetical protein [Nonomuraea angiospora]
MAVGGPQVRSLLAMLLLEACRPVSVGRPAAAIDGDAAQARAHHRAALEAAVRSGNLPAAADAVDGLAGAAG